MPSIDIYYALTLVANGASTPAYYSVTPTSDLSISQGGVTIVPTGPGSTLVNIYPQVLQISAPAGSVNGAVTIISGVNEIAGRLMVSPPVNVAVVVTLYGIGGKQIGQAILDPGEGSQSFAWPVDPSQGLAAGDVATLIKKLLPEPK
jgi:hypothetical protein